MGFFTRKYEKKSNKELLDKYLHREDVFAFQCLYERFEKRLWALFNAKVQNENDRRDLIQITYEKLLTSKGIREKNIDQFECYLMGIAFNTLKKYYSQKSKNRYTQIEEVLNPAIYTAEDLFDLEKFRQSEKQLNWLNEAIESLPNNQKMAIQMQLQSKSYAMIAESMNMSETGVGSLINRAKNNLRKKIGSGNEG